MILACQGGSIGCVYDGRIVTCPCSCGYDASGSGIYYNGGYSMGVIK